jgi:hypothetical protein
MRQYKIAVKALQGVILTYIVKEYKVVDGDFIEFIDYKTGVQKKFHASNCEIQTIELEGGN